MFLQEISITTVLPTPNKISPLAKKFGPASNILSEANIALFKDSIGKMEGKLEVKRKVPLYLLKT
jgi:hypothetical protein